MAVRLFEGKEHASSYWKYRISPSEELISKIMQFLMSNCLDGRFTLKMTHRLFEGKQHASLYQMYRFDPPDEIKEIIVQYLDRKKGQPHELAVDLGCGTGQNSRLWAPHFQQVVGMDISESQLKEARAVPGFANLTYRVGTAEELPFPDGSVDLLTASSAAHWFDPERFLKEATRVLKPRGCLALFGYGDNFKFYYDSCGDRLNNIYEDVKEVLTPFTSNRVAVANNKLHDLYEAITFPDKERIEVIPVKIQKTIKDTVGFFETFSMYQAYLRAQPSAAVALLETATSRFLKEMNVSSTEAKLELCMDYFCVLACKPH